MGKKRFQLKIRRFGVTPEDYDSLKQNYLHVKELSSLAKQCKDKKIRTVIDEEIRHVRSNLLNCYTTMWFKIELKLGPHMESTDFLEEYPFRTKDTNDKLQPNEIDNLKSAMIQKLTDKRRKNKQQNIISREFNGIRYDMVGPYIRPHFNATNGNLIIPNNGGRVFTKPGSIKKLMESGELDNRITRAKHPYDKAKYVGVELELITRITREDLVQRLQKARLSGFVYVKHDGSLRPDVKEHHTHEVTIIGKQQHINDIVERVCKVLNTADVGVYVNNTCGLHVHLDMRSRDPKICYSNMYKCIDILCNMVPVDRTANSFCMKNTDPVFNTRPNEDGNTARRKVINPMAFESHKTLEVRVHSGSTNAKKINNWIKLLVAMVERLDVVNKDTVVIDELKEHFSVTDDIVEYVKQRTERFKDKTIDTKKDEVA